MKLSGTNRPNSSRKMAIVVNRKGTMRKILKSGWVLAERAGGRRERMRKLAATEQASEMEPRMRIAQAQPTFSKRLCSMSGKTTPPAPPPVAAMPVAKPRLARKKCPTAAMEGVKSRAEAIPLRMPKERKKCQNSVG